MGVALGTAALSLAGGVIGDVMSQSGQQAANAQNTQNMLQQEQWQEQMSNTAMQRRVQDLKAAGLNPMLATGTSGAQVGGVGLPSIQNPNAAMAGLGSQVGSAVQAGQAAANIEQTKAQTDLIKAQTPGNVFIANDDGTPDFTRGNGGLLGNVQVGQGITNIQQGNALVQKIQQDTKTSASQESLNDRMQALQGINQGILEQTRQWLVQDQIAQTNIDVANVSRAQAEAALYSGPKGAWIMAIDKVLGAMPGAHSALNLLQRLK